MCGKVVILDAGHGGINPVTKHYVTPGKRSPVWPDGSVYYEGDGNREIVKIAAKMLVEKGVRVLYTVDPNGYQDTSLKIRTRTANDHYRKHRNAFLISVHSNGVSNPQAHGYEVFTSKGTTKSDAIATTWFKEHAKQFPNLRPRPDHSDGDPDKEASLAITRDTNCPAILIETMFHTNLDECKILMSYEGKVKIARAIVNTVLKYNG